MDFATNGGPPRRIALLLSPVNLRRLTGGLRGMVGPRLDFGAVEIDQPPARIMEQLMAMQPAGIIMEFREELTEPVSSLGRPVVVALADMLMEGIGCVNVDDFAVGRLAADYLWEKGLRHFGFYGFESLHAPGRKTGFLEGLRNRGADAALCELDEQARPARRLDQLDKWLAALARPAGVFAAHDPLAREVVERCARLGLRVPAEVAVLSASNDQFTCELVHPGISSVEIPWERVGLEAGRLLLRMLDGAHPAEPVVVPPTGIRTRGSTDYYRVADEWIQTAVAFMRENLDRDFGIDAVARAAGIDRRALERRFRAQLNRSPRQVLTNMRTERARELLEQSALRIGEIAAACGFGTSEKLAAAFRKRHGRTPREWRRAF